MERMYELLHSIAVVPMVYYNGTLYVNYTISAVMPLNAGVISLIVVDKNNDALYGKTKSVVSLSEFPNLNKIVYNPRGLYSYYYVPKFSDANRKITHVFNTKPEWEIWKNKHTLVTNSQKEYDRLKINDGEVLLLNKDFEYDLRNITVDEFIVGNTYFYIKDNSIHIFDYTEDHEEIDYCVYAIDRAISDLVIENYGKIIQDIYIDSNKLKTVPDYIISSIQDTRQNCGEPNEDIVIKAYITYKMN